MRVWSALVASGLLFLGCSGNVGIPAGPADGAAAEKDAALGADGPVDRGLDVAVEVDGAGPDGADAAPVDGAPPDVLEPDAGTGPVFVTRQGGTLLLGGSPFRFIGANIRGITHYGHGDVLPYAGGGEIDLNLRELAAMGGKVFRCFVAYEGISADEAANRMAAVLDVARQYDLYMLAVFTDFYATPFHPAGDGSFYAQDLNGFTVLNHAWFAGGYQQNYLPFVRTLVQRFRDEERIFAWELGNEIKDATFSDSNPDTFVSFARSVAATIKGLDPNHLVSVGIISVPNAGLSQAQAQALFGDPNVDIMTIRSYHGQGDDDTGLAAALGRPILVEEAGFSASDGDRPSLLAGDLNLWFGRGVSGYMQWGFMAAGHDNGDGDREFGMDRVFHSDWDGLFATYSNAASGL